jgi:folate-binding protein YgfZ
LREGYSPLEAGLLNIAISLTKGCYVGQEVIARIHYKGRLPRTLVLFKGENLQEEQKVFDGEKEVGLITSVSRKGLALGYILTTKLEEKREFSTATGKVVVLD